MSFKFLTYSYFKSQHLFARSVKKNRSVPTEAPNVSIRIFRAKHLHLYEGDGCSMLREIITMRHCGLHNIYYTSQESCKHKSVLFFFFSTSRVLETVRSVPTSRMGCSVCLAVPRACQARTMRWCGNTRTR